MKSKDAAIEDIEINKLHLIQNNESKYFSLKLLLIRIIGNITIKPISGKMDKNQIISHDTEPIIPIGIARRIPVIIIAQIRCFIR